jgi:hypothetical protein
MKRILAVAAVALATAVPAAASVSTSATVHGAGTVRSSGTVGPTAFFSIDFSKGKGSKLLYRAPGVMFHSQTLGTVKFSNTAVKIAGWGYVNGRLVPFTAIATDHPAPLGDWFKIVWARGASHGGRLTSGNIDIAQLLASLNGGGTPSAA